MWVIVAMGVLAVGWLGARRAWRQRDRADMGSVTERWLAEHRSHQPGESR